MTDACKCGSMPVTVYDSNGGAHTACRCETSCCDLCDGRTLTEWLVYVNGEMLHVCPDCAHGVRSCYYCDRDFMSDTDEPVILEDHNGCWVCDECRADRREVAYWTHVNHEIDRMIERRHGKEI